jgi:hypothetical protein
MERNRYADLLRVGAVGLVVIGHWLATDVTDTGGHLSGFDALSFISWGRWLTLIFQVMPVIFVVGGYANATSWNAHRAVGDGGGVRGVVPPGKYSGATWVRRRTLRLLRPTTLYVLAAALAVIGTALGGLGRDDLARAAWFVGLQLWFLPVYLLLILLTPALLRLHRRFGLAVPAAMAAAVALVDVGKIGWHVPVIGFANYLLGWGAIHQCGFAWQDGTLTRRRWRPCALAGGGLITLAALVQWGPFPIDMVGVPGEAVQNANPPSIALLAFAAALVGLLIAAEPAGQRLLASARRWRAVSTLNETTITVYLWHMVPVVLVAVASYPAGPVPPLGVGSWQWWLSRPAWIVLLAVVLVPVVMLVRQLERPLDHLPSGRADAAGRWPPVLILLGVAATTFTLARVTINGFAPDGELPVAVLAGYAAGLGLTVISGYPPGRSSPSSPAGPAGAGGPDRLALRSAGLSTPSSNAPATHTRPPLTTENVVDTS